MVTYCFPVFYIFYILYVFLELHIALCCILGLNDAISARIFLLISTDFFLTVSYIVGFCTLGCAVVLTLHLSSVLKFAQPN